MTRRVRLSHEFATQLAPLARAWRHHADTILSSLDISNSEGWALVHLSRLGEGARQGDLARALGIAEASLVPTVQQLERQGFVIRRADNDDRRVNQVLLTSEGAALAHKANTYLIDLRMDLLEDVSDAELEVLVRVFDKMSTRTGHMRDKS